MLSSSKNKVGIHTLVLTNIANFEAPLVRAVVRRPADQELVTRGRDVEGGRQVTAQRRQCGTVGCGT